jgi:hypothetical protein
MDFEEAAALLNAKRIGSSYVFKCPAHDDSRPSGKLTNRPDKEAWLVYCHAGCSLKDILTAVGLHLSDAFYGSRATKAASPSGLCPPRCFTLKCEDLHCPCQHRDIKADIAREKKLLAFQRHLDSEEKVVLKLPAIDWKL